MTDDKKRDYLVKTFLRTERKGFENYIIGGIWHKLGNDNIKPVTQQYIRRSNGSYALLDLYFPQINYAVEIDEAYHEKQQDKDAQRESDIQKMISAIDEKSIKIVRIDAAQSLNNINNNINNIVKDIKERYNKAGCPKWEIVDPVDYARKNKKISVSDNLEFDNLYKQIRRLFGKKEYAHSRVRCTFDVSSNNVKAYVWCPKLAIKELSGKYTPSDKKWENTLSADHKYIFEKYIGDEIDYRQKTNKPTSKNRTHLLYVFAKTNNCFNERCYKFLGVFEFHSLYKDTVIYKRLSEKLALDDFI